MTFFRSWQFWLGIAVSLVCLWLAVRDVPLGDLGHALAGARYIWLVPAIALQLLAVVARAQRWVVLLGQRGRLADSFWAQGIGYLFTNVFPLRLGEPARVAVMAERCHVPFLRVAGSAILERLLDVATVVVILIAILPWMRVPPLVEKAGLSFGVLILLLILALLLLSRFSRVGEAVLEAAGSRLRFLPTARLIASWRDLVSGLVPLARWQIVLPAVLYSAATWGLSIGVYWCILRAFDTRAAVVEAAFMIVALSLAVTVPSSPGFVGVFQLVGQQALVVPFGGKYSETAAFAVVMTAYVTYYLLTSTLGVVGLLRLGQSFANLGRILATGPVSEPAAPRDPAL
ncbi:MAG TPA: lysylphosphatidylglycerol synthase transmembrane domain-containing protein [Chloroflexota bacterium]|nr:lysylphosphatidylglycerol synthase transmembrane domain-containing protein [Chloroflexota bacterium]